MHFAIFLTLAVISTPLYFSLRKVFFPDAGTFKAAMSSLLSPDMMSLFREREDMVGELKGFGFVISCATLVLAEYFLFTSVLF